MAMQTRRDLVLSLPLLALAESLNLRAQSPAPAKPVDDLSHGTLIKSGSGIVKPNAHGAGVEIINGKLANGDRCEVHLTELNPGEMPHPPHQHKHMEFMFVREGQLDWMVNDQHYSAGPGDILFAASMDLHGLKNVGSTRAKYTVLELGNES